MWQVDFPSFKFSSHFFLHILIVISKRSIPTFANMDPLIGLQV